MILKRLENALRQFQFKPPESGEFTFSAVGEYTDDALKALDEWHAAENYFNSISDPDLIEYALYELEAAKRKYEYLMRKLRDGDAAYEQGGYEREYGRGGAFYQ
jgi:hypothetical protein